MKLGVRFASQIAFLIQSMKGSGFDLLRKSLPSSKLTWESKLSRVRFSSGCSTVGSAPGLGPGGPRFESAHPDQRKSLQQCRLFL